MFHFCEPDRIDPVAPTDHLSDEIYGAMLDHVVIACVDIVLTHGQQVLLVKRNRYPRSSWWMIGGRMVAGEDPQHTAVRKTAQELGIRDLVPDRLQYIGTYSTCFTFRHQAPQHHGSHTLNITYHVALTDRERVILNLHPDEHQTLQWLAIDQAIELLNTDQVMDQALLKILQDLQDCQVHPLGFT